MWRAKEGEDAYHDAIECAVRADHSSPASEFISALSTGQWAIDPEFNPPRDDEQIYDWARLLAKIEHVGINGSPPDRGAVNYLHTGVWEFRQGTRRLTYWDTPGDGTFATKGRIDDVADSDCPGDTYWWYPSMDAYLRLGVAWPKTGQKAPQLDIQEAIAVREEDCEHDREEGQESE